MKKICLMLAALLFLVGLGGCAKAPSPGKAGKSGEPEESAWEFTIGEQDFTIENLKAMDHITVDLELKGELGSYTGVPLEKLLNEAGITDFETLTLEAEDGYSASISREEALHECSILCYAVDGEDLRIEKNAPLMFASKQASTQAWVGKLKAIRVGE